MELNQVFYQNEYKQAYDFATKNNYTIKEIDADENGRRFQIIEIPQPTEEQILNGLRTQREYECFSVVNRGELWYNKLTEEQKSELSQWYDAWLDVTEDSNKDANGEYIIPEKPVWLK